ncbi:DsbA family protein [Thalassococcus sp. S3]|uniref:DsbA family protein n=1 Tax=Thalassococcus sp. S3 TaxID=2017482 RepID=UPI0010244F89|nr:DsbA family protein [Thalassococcus sp. S3]QBF33813.1 thiol-disulfide oxidoreductase [Thalassococcus sp. S3]
MTRIVAALAACVVLGLGVFAWSSFSGSPTPANPLVGAANAQESAEDIDTSGIVEMTMGSEDAPVTVIEYASYTCPHCATFHQGPFKQLKADYIDTGKVQFVYREVYFDRFGLWASMVARCAGPDKFFGITEVLYQDQPNWSRAGGPTEIVDELRRIGRLAGIENETLEACLQDGDKARTLVAWYQQNAEEHGVNSTPSFVINGTKYENMSYDDFAARIEAAAGS